MNAESARYLTDYLEIRRSTLLLRWSRLMENWAEKVGLESSPICSSNLQRLLEKVLYIVNEHDLAIRSHQPLFECPEQRAVTRSAEPICLGLYETGQSAFRSTLDEIKSRNAKAAKEFQEVFEFVEELVETALKALVHQEIDTCVRLCGAEGCPFAKADLNFEREREASLL